MNSALTARGRGGGDKDGSEGIPSDLSETAGA